jgi:hypothetical protein
LKSVSPARWTVSKIYSNPAQGDAGRGLPLQPESASLRRVESALTNHAGSPKYECHCHLDFAEAFRRKFSDPANQLTAIPHADCGVANGPTQTDPTSHPRGFMARYKNGIDAPVSATGYITIGNPHGH